MEDEGNFLRRSVNDITSLLDINFGSLGRPTRGGRGRGARGCPSRRPESVKPILERVCLYLGTEFGTALKCSNLSYSFYWQLCIWGSFTFWRVRGVLVFVCPEHSWHIVLWMTWFFPIRRRMIWHLTQMTQKTSQHYQQGDNWVKPYLLMWHIYCFCFWSFGFNCTEYTVQ